MEHKHSSERMGIGSVCIEKVESLGGAYRNFEDFKKKIDKLCKIKNWSKDELKRLVAEKSGELEKEYMDLAEIEERIEQAKKERREEMRKKKKKQREKKWTEQNAKLEEEGLLEIEGNCDFVDDIIDQHLRGKILSEKQVDALRRNRDKIVEIHGSVNEWKEKYMLQKQLLDLFFWLVRKCSIWEKHRDVINSMSKFYHDSESIYEPKLTEKQLSYAKSIVQHYEGQLADLFGSKEMLRKDFDLVFER